MQDAREYPLITGVVGSHAYGLNHADSDTDRMSVFTFDTKSVLGLKKLHVTRESSDEDHVHYEVAHFVRLAMRSNPTVNELLWLDSYETLTSLGEYLIDIREAFLSAPYVRSAYLGYARSQLGKMQDNPKAARHFIRLLNQGLHLYTTGYLGVRVDDTDSVQSEAETFIKDPGLAEAQFDRVKRAFDEVRRSPLPLEPDYDTINTYLLNVRVAYYL